MGILVMKDYLAIIRKLDFVDLFKYGQFGINYAVVFDGHFDHHADDDELFNRLTSRMNMYEYSFEYLIIHFKSAEEDNAQYKLIDIRNVQGVYTFDAEAQKEMSISFDNRIQLHVSPWSEKFEKLQQELNIKQSTRGVYNLWDIFGLAEEDRRKCEELITSDTIQEVFRELYAYERPFGNQSIWTYLLRYERHSFYPKGMLGYFCDFVHVFCNYKEQKELSGEVAETTQLYQQLLACKNPQFAPLYEIVNASPLSKMTEEAFGCRFAVAAPLFLYLKAEFADGMEHIPDEKIVSYAKKIGGFEYSIAVYLLGLTLGYDKTYDAFYEATNLPFFKKINTPKIPSETLNTRFPEKSETSTNEVNIDVEKLDTSSDILQKNEATNMQQNPDTVKTDIQENYSGNELSSNNTRNPLAWMKKGTGKKANVQPIYTEDERNKLYNFGFGEVKRFTDTVKEIIVSYGFNPEVEMKRFAKKRKSN